MMKKISKKIGFTLIELLAVIIILAVVSLIATPIIINVIDAVKISVAKSSTYVYIEQIEKEVALANLKNAKYLNKDSYSYDEIEVNMSGMIPNGGTYSLKNGIIVSGTFCTNGYVMNYENRIITIGDKNCDNENMKLNGSIKLSSNSGNYVYPEQKNIEITENLSGGNVTCISSNEDIASCLVEGNIITVKSGTKKGNAILTIKSEATENYKEAKASYLASTELGLLSVTINGYHGIYDGQNHGISVVSNDSTIKYGVLEGIYELDDSPKYSDAGEYIVYFKISKEGYQTIIGSEKVTIVKSDSTLIAPASKQLVYTGNSQILITAGNTNNGTIEYKLNDGNYSTDLPSATDAGVYKVYYRLIGDKNHFDIAEKSINVTIKKKTDSILLVENITTYNGSEHLATVSSESGLNLNVIYYSDASCISPLSHSPVESGLYYVKATTEGNVNYTEATLDCTKAVIIEKADNVLILSDNNRTYTYPNSGSFTVTKNLSGGKITCNSSDSNIATCSVLASTITVNPGTTKGSANITITSEETSNYKSQTVTHVAITEEGLLSVTASGYEGAQDGLEHGITVTSSGSIIKYGISDGKYDLDSSPVYTEVGTYTIYYQVSRLGYKSVTGSKQVKIIEEELKAPLINSSLSSTSNIIANYDLGSATSGIANSNCYITNSSGTVISSGRLQESNCEFDSLLKDTVYYYKKCIISKVGNTVCSDVSSILTAGKVINYDFTGAEQIYKTSCNGIYKLETWGAQGGSTNFINSNVRYNAQGGYGGYTVANTKIDINTNIYVNVGGMGSSTSTTAGGIGGYNGGGQGGLGMGYNTKKNYFYTGGAGGGGATHIALSSGLLSELENFKSNLLNVSGGGGGASGLNKQALALGSSGGGIEGSPGYLDSYTYYFVNGASQTTGYKFGLGGSALQTNEGNSWAEGGAGGGGGGYYGGLSSTSTEPCSSKDGGAGSGYIGNSLLTDKYMYCYNCKESNEDETKTITTTCTSSTPTANCSKQGNGYAKITILSCSN